MNKKLFEIPEMELLHVKSNDIICTSNEPNKEPEAENETYQQGSTRGWF